MFLVGTMVNYSHYTSDLLPPLDLFQTNPQANPAPFVRALQYMLIEAPSSPGGTGAARGAPPNLGAARSKPTHMEPVPVDQGGWVVGRFVRQET